MACNIERTSPFFIFILTNALTEFPQYHVAPPWIMYTKEDIDMADQPSKGNEMVSLAWKETILDKTRKRFRTRRGINRVILASSSRHSQDGGVREGEYGESS